MSKWGWYQASPRKDKDMKEPNYVVNGVSYGVDYDAARQAAFDAVCDQALPEDGTFPEGAESVSVWEEGALLPATTLVPDPRWGAKEF